MADAGYPSLYQINTRVYLSGLAASLGRRATLDDVPDALLDWTAGAGFTWLWFLSVWRTGTAGQRVSRNNPEWRHDFRQTLPDLQEADIGGSGFAIQAYEVHPDMGGDAALARLRARLQQRGLRLMLDFVPNHTAIDHPWVSEHCEYYVAGTDQALASTPQNYLRIEQEAGSVILAYGRDPYFPGWPDTLQLDYGNAQLQDAMIAELHSIAARCDGVRCDMAMLLLPDVFEHTWQRQMTPFWPQAIAAVRAHAPDFCLLAEAYWDREWPLLQQGFDYVYDKRLYDRLRAGSAAAIRQHLQADISFQNRLVRFLENHDEPRAAATFSFPQHRAAAVVAYLSPGMRFFQQGQIAGRRQHISPHLVRGPTEAVDTAICQFYRQLLNILRGWPGPHAEWQLLSCLPAWDGNWTSDCFVACCWRDAGGRRMVVVVNYADNQSQCQIRLPWADLAEASVRLDDQMSGACYTRDGNSLLSPGLFVDLPPWGSHVFVAAKDKG